MIRASVVLRKVICALSRKVLLAVAFACIRKGGMIELNGGGTLLVASTNERCADVIKSKGLRCSSVQSQDGWNVL